MFKRGRIYWTTVKVDGKFKNSSLKTGDRNVAKVVEAKLKLQIMAGAQEAQNIEIGGEQSQEGIITIREAFERFTKERPNRVGQAQIYRDQSSQKTLIPFLGNYPMDKVPPRLIADYKRKRFADGVKGSTTNREVDCLSALYSMARQDWGFSITNPCNDVRRERETERDRFLTVEEEKRLMEKAPEWMRSIITFALNTGMREGAIFLLRWESIDLFGRTITVRAATNKRERPQVVPMTTDAFELLKGLCATRGANVPWVFPNQDGRKRNGAGRFGHTWRKAVANAGIEDLRFHDLRHTFATRLVQGGTDLYLVSKLLGHRSIATTQRYAHHVIESLRKGLEPLNRGTGI